MPTVLLTLLLAIPALLTALEGFHGRVVGVVDGDTIKVMHDGSPVSVRLYGIDSPERKQPFGTRAKQFTADLAFGKEVRIIPRGRHYNRIVAEVVLPDGRLLSHELVRAGMAWWYVRYAPRDHVLEALEAEARSVRHGLWSAGEAVSPWEFRRLEQISRR